MIAAIRDAAVVAAPCIVGNDGNRDGLPTVLLEAMALGTPCVSTAVTGIPELLRDGETGLSVRTRSACPRSAIERLLDDGALRVRLAARRGSASNAISISTAIRRTMRALFRDACRYSASAVGEFQEVG